MKKGKTKTFIILTIVFLVMSFMLLGYFCYKKFFTNKLYNSSSIHLNFKSIKNTNKVYQSSEVLIDNDINYLVVKKNDRWYEVDQDSSDDNGGFYVLGAYKDKLYYATSTGINYVDLNDDSLNVVKFVTDDNVNCNNIFYVRFDNDILYIEILNTNSVNNEDDSSYSIISYNLNEIYQEKTGKSILTIKENPANFYVINKKIFYLIENKHKL